MLKLIANNSVLDISDVSFNLTMRSPVAGSTAGSYVYSFSIPYSNKNASIFGFPFRINRFNTSTVKMFGQILFNGIPIQEGNWTAINSKAKNIQVEMLIGAGSFSDYIEGKILPDVFDLTIDYPSIVDHVNSQVHLSYPEAHHNFPAIHNPLFYEDSNVLFRGIINDYSDQFLQEGNLNTIVPILYLLYVVRTIYEKAGYSVKGDPFDDPYFHRAQIYNNFALDKIASTYFYGEIENTVINLNTNWIITFNKNIQDPGSHWNMTTGKYLVNSSGTYQVVTKLTHRLETVVPVACFDFYFIEIWYGSLMVRRWQHVAKPDENQVYTNYHNYIFTIEVPDLNDRISLKYYFTDCDGNHIEGKIISGHMSIVNVDVIETNVYENSISYKNHVPSIDIKEFLNSFFATAEMLPFFDDKSKTIEFKYLSNLLSTVKQVDLSQGLIKDSLKLGSSDWNGISFQFDFQGPDNLISNKCPGFQEKPESVLLFSDLYGYPGEIKFVVSLNAYYINKVLEDEPWQEWQLYGHNYPGLTLGDGEMEVSSKLSPMLMRNVNIHGFNQSMPAIEAGGTSNAFGIEEEFPLRIMFWYGIETSALHDYPYASSTKYRPNGEIFMPASWLWNDIVALFWNEVLPWYENRIPVEFDNITSPSFISNIDFNNKFFFNKSLLLLTETYTNISNKSFGPSKIRGWTIGLVASDVELGERIYVDYKKDPYTNYELKIYVP